MCSASCFPPDYQVRAAFFEYFLLYLNDTFRQQNAFQTTAAFECLLSNLLYCPGKHDLLQAFAAGKHAAFQLRDTVRQLDTLQAPATAEQAEFQFFQTARQSGIHQLGTLEKGKAFHLDNAVRQPDLPEGSAFPERICADLCDTVRNHDALQTGILAKCIVPDGCHAVIDLNVCPAALVITQNTEKRCPVSLVRQQRGQRVTVFNTALPGRSPKHDIRLRGMPETQFGTSQLKLPVLLLSGRRESFGGRKHFGRRIYRLNPVFEFPVLLHRATILCDQVNPDKREPPGVLYESVLPARPGDQRRGINRIPLHLSEGQSVFIIHRMRQDPFRIGFRIKGTEQSLKGSIPAHLCHKKAQHRKKVQKILMLDLPVVPDPAAVTDDQPAMIDPYPSSFFYCFFRSERIRILLLSQKPVYPPVVLPQLPERTRFLISHIPSRIMKPAIRVHLPHIVKRQVFKPVPDIDIDEGSGDFTRSYRSFRSGKENLDIRSFAHLGSSCKIKNANGVPAAPRSAQSTFL